MARVGEHVDRLHELQRVTRPREVAHVADLRLGVAADVDDARGRQPHERIEELGGRPRARRVHEHDVGPFARIRHAAHEIARVGRDEPGVLHPVVPRVVARVADGRLDRVHAHDLRGAALGRDEADGAGAAVGVDDALRAVQARERDGALVEHGGLHGVHLVERLRRYAEAKAAERVEDEARAVQPLLALAQDDVRLARVHVLHHRRDERALLRELAAERLGVGERVVVGHERHEHFAALVAHAHDHVAHEARAAVLVVGRDLVLEHDGLHGRDHALAVLVFHEAAARVDDPVRPRGVHARQDTLPAVGAALARREGRHDLVAVAVRALHAEYRAELRLGEFTREQLAHARILRGELLGVRNVNAAASPAFAGRLALHPRAYVGWLCFGVPHRWPPHSRYMNSRGSSSVKSSTTFSQYRESSS